MPNISLIAGASSGIGAKFARYHASKKGDLIIVARRLEALNALKRELGLAYGVTVHVVAQDFGETGGADALITAVDALNVPVNILINNTGFGGHGGHIERKLAD